MKSKSFDLKPSSAEKHAFDKTLDFVGLYKSVADTNKVAEKRKSDETINKETVKAKTGTPKRELTANKNKKRSKQETLDISQIKIDGSNLNTSTDRSSPVRDLKVTSTPNASNKNQDQAGGVKSIMKNKSVTEHSTESPRSVSSGKPKKRNKSVSFMLDDNEEVVVKRTKSDDSKVGAKPGAAAKTVIKDKNKNIKKLKKYQQSEKENKAAEVNNLNMEVDAVKTITLEKKPAKFNKTKKMLGESSGDAKSQAQEIKEKKKKIKKVKKAKPENSEPTDTDNNNEVPTESKAKKLKKKKVKSPPTETTEGEGEPAPKARRKDAKPEAIAEDLENLSIGDNAHTLTNLLDEMTVVDKTKRKQLRQKFNKNKKPKGPAVPTKEDAEKSEEVKEKIKWKKRKWNKDKKGDMDEDSLAHTVIVENLPISIMLNYKKLLTDQFIKHGPIKKFGIAEVYPTEESKPVFTTTINFHTSVAAEKALEENHTYVDNSRIRVKRALPATQTTLVVRSYAELTDQALSTTFLGAGKIRSIRHLVKGKNTMSTAFIEFDGPEAVERAIKLAGDTKIGGKKIHLSKFEIRAKKVKKHKSEGDSAADADSEDSND
ncbi:neurofilament heavy polypeptide [Helicoverpa armigera]|uniref:neurofilament heavy polypeptide n=1 Tax=Helicoverpa armigera TaxID=29058 RepID=UPI0030838055